MFYLIYKSKIEKSLNQKFVIACGRRSLKGYVVQRMQLYPVFHSVCGKLFYLSIKNAHGVFVIFTCALTA